MATGSDSGASTRACPSIQQSIWPGLRGQSDDSEARYLTVTVHFEDMNVMMVDAWQLENWEAYRNVARLGRKTRLPEAQCTVLWSIFERVRAELKRRKLITHAELFSSLAAVISKNKNVVFDFAVVDEAPDISVAHLRFFAVLNRTGRTTAALDCSSAAKSRTCRPLSSSSSSLLSQIAAL